MNFKSKRGVILFLGIVLTLGLSLTVFGAEAEEAVAHQSKMYASGWSLMPPVIAIVLALITKEVYSSLFVGIVAGALFYSNFNVEMAYLTIFTNDTEGGMLAKLSDSWNVGILIFLVVLGIMVSLVNKAGGSAAYGEWAAKKIKNKKQAGLATFGLGVLIFVDDYFNCLTVGSVMRPITDKFKISRAKLAYIIDATAAPVCIIAPISSWAAAVTGVVEGYNGLDLFIRAIPYNYYAILTIIMMICLFVMNFDYGPMRVHEVNANNGDLYTTSARPYANASESKISSKGGVIDLVAPVAILIICCIIGMVYTGGFFATGEAKVSFAQAFADCDASRGLTLGSTAALLFTFIFYIPRRVLSFREFMDSFPEGFKAMVPAILILVFAWTLSGITGLLGADKFVEALLDSNAKNLASFLPAIVFLFAVGLSFSTGTSWGTFGILLPVVVPVVEGELLIITVSACLAGAVCGDHCSPISDTTIMASTGAQSDHINHVSTQLPYALTVAVISFLGYILTALVQNWLITLPIMILALIGTLLILKNTIGSEDSI